VMLFSLHRLPSQSGTPRHRKHSAQAITPQGEL
jgi:hypothetical protein